MQAEKIRAEMHQQKKPEWLKVRLPSNPVFFSTKDLVEDLNLHTVCESAQCPNRWECWSCGTATFMIAGENCTRACGFCAVATAKPLALDKGEPGRVGEAVRRLRLRHVVVTSVARDDLADGGAEHFAQTIRAIREVDGEIVIEVLTPDFHARDAAIRVVLDAEPDVFNHNLETVERLSPLVRSRARYGRSLEVLRKAKEYAPHIATKSGIMLGLGEREDEVISVFEHLLAQGVQILTVGQYLRPSPKHLPVIEYVTPEAFARYGEIAKEMGFEHVASGPLVRSSYHAAEFNPVGRRRKS